MIKEKIVPGFNVGDRVEAFYNNRPDCRVSGTVIENTENVCVIDRDDVPPVEQFVDGKNVLVPLKAYIFGNSETTVFSGGDVIVRNL